MDAVLSRSQSRKSDSQVSTDALLSVTTTSVFSPETAAGDKTNAFAATEVSPSSATIREPRSIAALRLFISARSPPLLDINALIHRNRSRNGLCGHLDCDTTGESLPCWHCLSIIKHSRLAVPSRAGYV